MYGIFSVRYRIFIAETAFFGGRRICTAWQDIVVCPKKTEKTE